MTKEKLIEKIMKECEADGEPVTRAEAEEMAEMELKANETRHYEKSDKPRKKVKKERKVDTTKKRLLSNCRVLLEDLGANILAVKTETEVTFTFENEEYSLKLIKHRPKKQAKKQEGNIPPAFICRRIFDRKCDDSSIITRSALFVKGFLKKILHKDFPKTLCNLPVAFF